MTVVSTTGTEQGSAVRSALDAAAKVVGADRVRGPFGDGPEPATTTLGPSISGHRPREVYGVIQPRTTEEVRQVVEIFGRSPEAGSLHPYSTGRNWGLGSRDPAYDHAVVLDLGGLDRVRHLDVAAGWAVVEPGVTQGRLADLLAETGRMVNVTVSSAHTSVLGNALDRGVGLRHQRVEDLVGLEVVLPSGELIHVGWWPEPDRPTPVYAHGLGPSLVQMFVQSNLGVVTAAAIRLLPRPEALRVVRLNFVPEALPGAVDELRRWVSQGLVRGVLKVYNPPAAKGYGDTSGHFLAHVCVDGTAAAVEALTAIIADEANRSGLFTEVSHTDATDPAAANHEVARLVERSYAGDPDGNDVLFEAKMGRPAGELDELGGFLFFLPLVPFSGVAVAHADELLQRVQAETGVRFGATLNVLNPDVVDFVVTMKFERRVEEFERGHRALDRLYELFSGSGFIPYRLDIDHCDWIDRFTPDPTFRTLVRRLKDLIDPHQAIAPGRYA